mmetsp:Transcript_8037/g.24767  ORF Transcript_8037/g.24767 Transcript_8037/m.24767 type:complete len:499 (-) Transcript_8037:2130-3626(-)
MDFQLHLRLAVGRPHRLPDRPPDARHLLRQEALVRRLVAQEQLRRLGRRRLARRGDHIYSCVFFSAEGWSGFFVSNTRERMWWDKVRRLDAYPKTLDEFRVRTLQGGVSTVAAVVVALWLTRNEFRYSLGVYTTERLYVNSSHGASISVAFDVEFPRISCDLVSVAATDASGQALTAFSQHVRKLRLDKNGRRRSFHSRSSVGETATAEEHITGNVTKECGDCYGAQDEEHECCQTCEDVRNAYRRKGWTFRASTVSQCRGEGLKLEDLNEEGCAVAGDLVLASVSGNFHFAPGRHVAEAKHLSAADLVALTYEQFNVSHLIKRLEFSQHEHLSSEELEERSDDDDDDDGRAKKQITARQRRQRRKRRRIERRRAAASPLAGARRAVNDGYGMHQYYLKVVPSYYRRLDGQTTAAAQYSVTEHLRHVAPGSGRGLPGVFFFYEVSPLCAEVREQRDGFLAFFVGLAAILGGVYVTFGVLDKLLASAIHALSAPHHILR